MEKKNQSAQPESTADTDKAQKQIDKADHSTDAKSAQRPSLRARSSLESTATTLPSYSKQPDQPPKYGSPGMVSGRPNKPKPQGQPISAASLSAVMATSSSSNDKMHSKPSKKVDDWNKDHTYKGRLSRMMGSTGKWNYFGSDIGGNPFSRKK